ncbi:MAG: F420-0:Gamma-glutamyl ligase [Firmicutes bacterium ADurb.Bin300]|jgi:F420-0:gamma-glutamyl ligase-like protein|nr:MAG: F420-0:Gamma-glutamyl ligase [Firmicutes bacterium ADurb.Bin300]
MEFVPNESKKLEISTEFGDFLRLPIKTHVVVKDDSLVEIIDKYVKPHIQDGDMIFISEKIVAISQGRAFDIDDIKPSRLARVLCKFVVKTPYGIGLGSPWTMELALKDVGIPRILFAAFCSAITKPFGIRGVFYRIAGTRARAIDGPCECTIPPYNHAAKLAPLNPEKVAIELMKHTGCMVAIMDANDLGREVLGTSDDFLSVEMCKAIFEDNPLGQGREQTPIAIVRKIFKEE